MKKQLNAWFDSLDSFTISYMFPGLFSEVMESADPERCSVNHFVKEAKKRWLELSDADKERLHEAYRDMQ